MPRYPMTVLDFRLQSGERFTATACGYSGKVQHIMIGTDNTRYLRNKFVDIMNSNGRIVCGSAGHCLATGCSLNQTEPKHQAHVLEMNKDEPLDDETAKACGTKSTVEALVHFANKMNELVPKELRRRQEPVQ
jgi:hypothetical protein